MNLANKVGDPTVVLAIDPFGEEDCEGSFAVGKFALGDCEGSFAVGNFALVVG
jgi:hypothetical protein